MRGILSNQNQEWPKSIEEAVDRLLKLLSKEDVQSLKNAKEEDLIKYHFSLGALIRNEFGMWKGNDELLKSCMKKRQFAHPDEVSSIIIEAVRKKLQNS